MPLTDEVVRAAIAKSGWERGTVAALEVFFTGGEVTLREELTAAVTSAKNAGAAKVTLRTNGRMLAYRGVAQGLREAGVDAIEVALHGHIDAVHDWETRVEGSFKQSLRGLKRARRAGCETGVNTVVTRSNYRHLAEIAAIVVRSGATSWRIHELRGLGAAAKPMNALTAPPQMQEPFIRRGAQLARRHGVDVTVLRADGQQQDQPHEH